MAEWQDADTLIWWLAAGLAILLVLAGSMLVFTRLYVNKRMADAQRLANMEVEHQKALLNDSILVQEKERERIARDLHDDLISKLNIMVLLAETDRDQQAEVLQTAIKTARRISHDLSPPMLSGNSFPELLQPLVDHFEKAFSLRYFLSDCHQVTIADRTKLQGLRIIQEVLNNVVVHAEATSIELGVRLAPTYLSVAIRDNGKGFDPEKIKNGLGLQNIEMRTQLLNGQQRVHTAPGKGTAYFLYFPLNSAT